MIDLLRKYNSDIDEQWLTQYKPLVILPCGYPGHGKTTLLASLCFMMDRLPRRLSGFTLQPADTHTRRFFPWFVEKFKNRSLEEATNVAEIPPFVCAASNLPASNSPGATHNRLVTFFDVAGEAVRAGSSCSELLSAPLPHCHVPWLIFNLGSRVATERITSLLESYIHLMTCVDSARSLEGKRVVLVYTCTDLLLDQLPTEVVEYLNEDADFGLSAIDSGSARTFDLLAYMAKAERISKRLMEFTEQNVHDGPALMNLARSYGLDLKFCATSATGHLATNGEMFEDPTPRRVLDPLLWSLYEQPEEPTSHDPINLMIHADCCRDLQSRDIMLPLLQELKKFHPLEIYYLGRTRPERLHNSSNLQLTPPKESYPSLVMPLLENCTERSRTTVVITHVPICDSDDAIRSSRFVDKIQWIVTDEEMCSAFDDAVYLNGSAEVQATVRHVVARIRQMYNPREMLR